MIGLYLTGIVCGILYAILLKFTQYKGEPVPFVMELPNYRFPSARSVGQLIWEKARDFLQKAFTIIFVATVLIWFLQTFDARLNVAATPDASLLAGPSAALLPPFLNRSALATGVFLRRLSPVLPQKKALFPP